MVLPSFLQNLCKSNPTRQGPFPACHHLQSCPPAVDRGTCVAQVSEDTPTRAQTRPEVGASVVPRFPKARGKRGGGLGPWSSAAAAWAPPPPPSARHLQQRLQGAPADTSHPIPAQSPDGAEAWQVRAHTSATEPEVGGGRGWGSSAPQTSVPPLFCLPPPSTQGRWRKKPWDQPRGQCVRNLGPWKVWLGWKGTSLSLVPLLSTSQWGGTGQGVRGL